MKHFITILFLFISCVKDESRDADNLYESKNFIEAIELYNEIINLKPNDIQSIYRRGRSYEELTQFELAFKDYQKVLELDNKNSNATLSIAIHHIRNSNYILAEKYSKKAIKINNELHQAYFILGRSLQYQGNFKDAVKAFDTSISLNSNYSDSYYYLGLIYLKLKNDKKACKNFSLAASLNNFDAINVKKKYCY